MAKIVSTNSPHAGALESPTFNRWTPALRRAVMRVRPDYFTWPLARQERYGVACPAKDEKQLLEALYLELFGVKLRKARDMGQFHSDRLTPIEQDKYNEAILPLTGIGANCFYLNESLPTRKTILSFGTLRDFDEWDYHYQEAARKNEDATYVSQPYRGSLYLSWARLFVDDVFTYATLSMAAGYLYSQLSEAMPDLIAARIPHRHVRGENHGKRENEAWQWDMRVDAGGQEALLEELQRQVYLYQAARYQALLCAWHEGDVVGVYLLDTALPNENNLHAVFSNSRALDAIRFRSFLADCRAQARPIEELSRAVQAESRALADFIQDKHNELIRTFDPKIVPLRKRRRILVHKNAFDDIG